MSIPYQFTRASSKANAFCWMTGEPSLWDTPQQRVRASLHAERVRRIGTGFFPQHTTNFKPSAVGASVAADRARIAAAREFKG